MKLKSVKTSTVIECILATIVLYVASGCATSQISSAPTLAAHAGAPSIEIKAIAMSPDGGLLADAVAVELNNRGYVIIDSGSTSRMMIRLNLNEVDIALPVGLAKLKEQGIDAVLSVRSAGGYDDQPQSASARLSSTATGRVVAGISWQNGWGGQAGSLIDRAMRKGLAQAAKDIADGLMKNLRQ